MAKNILSLKLCQLDDCFEKLHRRIDLSQAEDPSKLELEIAALERECVCAEAALMDKLLRTQSHILSLLWLKDMNRCGMRRKKLRAVLRTLLQKLQTQR